MLPPLSGGAKTTCRPPKRLFIPPIVLLTMQDIINVIAISAKGKSRIGKKLTMAIVEQDHHDKMFVVFHGTNECRWIKKDNDPDFRIIEED